MREIRTLRSMNPSEIPMDSRSGLQALLPSYPLSRTMMPPRVRRTRGMSGSISATTAPRSSSIWRVWAAFFSCNWAIALRSSRTIGGSLMSGAVRAQLRVESQWVVITGSRGRDACVPGNKARPAAQPARRKSGTRVCEVRRSDSNIGQTQVIAAPSPSARRGMSCTTARMPKGTIIKSSR